MRIPSIFGSKWLRTHRRMTLTTVLWLFVFVGMRVGLLDPLDHFLVDSVAGLNKPQPRDDVVVVAIDPPSLKEVALPWPWPRSVHATLVRALSDAGAKTIVFDVVFDQSTEQDTEFASAMEAAGNVILAAERMVQSTRFGLVETFSPPAPALLSAAKGYGVARLELDRDGVLRRMPDEADSLFKITSGREIESNTDEYIRFRPEGDVLIASYYQALSPDEYLPADFFRDKTVIVGLVLESSPDLGTAGDMVRVPGYAAIGGQAPGVIAQANILMTALDGGGPVRAPKALELIVLILAVGCSVLVTRFASPKPLLAFASGMLAITAGMGAAWIAYLSGVVLFVSAALMGVASITFVQLSATGFIAYRQRKRIAEGFARYVSPSIMRTLLVSKDPPALGGAEQDVSVIVTDLEGFTSFMESAGPDIGGRVLRDYLDALAEIVLSYDGTIDQFIGDSIVAIFNAPVRQSDHAIRAVSCAVDLQEEGKRFAEANRNSGLNVGVTRIGVDTGSALVGNFGASRRFHYTAMGDVMNTASRLESACKDVGVTLLLTGRVYEKAGSPA
ncbi:MAG: adenylate/guanylate cyclase domain-containing protein, partial [Pseudomonadota bacterium]